MKFFSKYVLALIYTLSLIFAGISVGSASVGKVTVVEGSVDVLKAKKAEVTPVKVGDPVDIGDIYRTKTGSYAEIKFYNDSILRIGARTRVEIKEYMVEKERTSQVMKLHRGRIQAIATEEIVKKAAALVEGHKFEVHTPTAVAGIRGSNMLVGFSQGTTVVVFIKGRGYVFNPAQPHIILPISQGQVSFIKGDLPPSPPTKAPENFIKEEGRAFLRIEEVKKEEKREPSEEVRVTVTTTPDVGPSAPDVPVREAAIEDYAALRDIAFYERGFETLLPREVVGVSFVRTLAEIEPPRLPFYGVKKETLLEGALQIDTNKGRFLGRVDEKGRGDFSFSVQFPQLDSLPSPYIVSGILEGTSDKAGAFFGVQRSIIGSVDTLLSSFYVEGSTLYFLTGQGSGSYEANVLSSTGRLVRSEPIGNLSLKIPPGGNLLSALKDKVKSITFGSGPVTYSSFYSPPPENYFLRLDTGLLAGLFATQFYLSHQNQSPWRFSYDWFLPTQTSFEFQWLFGQAVWDYTDPTKGIGRGNLELIGYINNIGPIIGEATANIASRFYDSRDMLLVSSGTYIADVASFMVSSGVLPTSGFYEFRTEDGTVGFFRGSGPSQMAGFVVGKGDIWSSPSPIRFVGLYSPEKKKDFFFLDFVTADLNGVSPNYAFGFPVFKAGYALENTDCYGGIIGASIKDKFIAEGLAFYAKKIGNEYEVGYFKLSDLEGSFFPEIGSYTASGKIEISKLGTTNTLPDSMEHDDVILKVGSGPISGYLVVGTVSPSSTQWTLLMSALSANYTSVPTGNWVSKVGSFEAEKFRDFWYVNLFLGDLRGDAWDSLTRTFSATLSGTEINIESEPEGNYLFLHENAITFRGIFGEEKALGVGTGIVDESKKKPLNLANHFGVFGDIPSVYTPISGNLYIREFIQKVQVDGHEEWHEDRRFLVVTEGMGYGIFKDSYRGEEAYYFPDGTMVEIDMGGKAIFRYGWRNIEYIRHDHLKRSQWLIPDDPTFQVWYSKFPNVKLLEKASGRVLGAIGGLGYPWGDKGTDLTIIGRYDGSEYPFFFNTPPLLGRFYDPENRREIGAYVLTLGGYVTGDERMSLWGRGLYIKDDGQEAGILVFQDLEATFFRGIDMWHAKGTIVREVVSSSNGASVSTDLSFNPLLANITGSFLDRSVRLGTETISGVTVSFLGQEWGIFSGYVWMGGLFRTKPQSETTEFNAYISGAGYFGDYGLVVGLNGENVSNFRDWGHFLIPLAGRLERGVIKTQPQNKKGIFMTLTKMGEITGEIGGLYERFGTSSVSYWYGQISGHWKTTRHFKFASSSDLETYAYVIQHYGRDLGQGSVLYEYQYEDLGEWAEFKYYPDRDTIKKRVYERGWGYEEFTYNKRSDTFPDYTRGVDYPEDFSGVYKAIMQSLVGDSYQGVTSPRQHEYLHSGWMSFIMGGVDDLWNASDENPAKVYFLGSYERPLGKRSVFAGELVSWNEKTKRETTLDEKGAYIGYIAGREIDGDIDGSIYAIYLRKNTLDTSYAGILKGTLRGKYYDDPEMWYGEGTLYPIELINDNPSNYNDIRGAVFSRSFYHDGDWDNPQSPFGFFMNDRRFTGKYFSHLNYTMLNTGSFGVWNVILGGNYNGLNVPDSWTGLLRVGDYSRHIGIGLGKMVDGSPSIWLNGKIDAGAIGFGADIQGPPFTWISVGDVKGSFNPNKTFQMVISGISMETNTYLTMVDAIPQQLQKLNIPTVEVGSTTLSGSWGNVNGDPYLSLTMENVRFFRATNSSQEVPKIWATDSVRGNYRGNPQGAEITLQNSQNTISMNFTLQTFDFQNRRWMGFIPDGHARANSLIKNNGQAQHPEFRMTGVAAGTINTSNNTITGTAAGFARPQVP